MADLNVILLGGLIGGAARALLGYLGESEDDESFSWKKFFKSLVRSAIVGTGVTYTLVATGQANFTFWGALFGAAGFGASGDVTWKNLWDVATSKPSPPGG